VGHDNLVLSKEEAKLAKQIAEREGITEEEAATRLLQAAIARRVRKRTGKGPAKVYTMRAKR
jgi:hypothetical protein